MTALATSKPRAYETGFFNEHPVKALTTVYEGSATTLNASGHIHPLDTANGPDSFSGFCRRDADNSTGSAADINAQVRDKGLVQLAVTGVVVTSVRADVYGSDDNTFTLTEGSNVHVGTVYRYVSNGNAIVEFDANHNLSAASYIVVAAGEFTTAGGDADETITVTGALATDLVHVTLHTAGGTPVTIIDAAAAAGQIDVDMSADPSTDHILTYSVLRAAN